MNFENYDCRSNYGDMLSARTFGNELHDLELQKDEDKSQVFKTMSKITAVQILAWLCSLSTPRAAGQCVPENSAWTLAQRQTEKHFQDCEILHPYRSIYRFVCNRVSPERQDCTCYRVCELSLPLVV